MAEADPRRTFNVHDAKTQLSRLIDRAHAGEEIIVAKAGVPWAKLTAVTPPTPAARTSGGLTLSRPLDLAHFLEALPEDELAYIDDRAEHERR